jgi:hypothetical protein
VDLRRDLWTNLVSLGVLSSQELKKEISGHNFMSFGWSQNFHSIDYRFKLGDRYCLPTDDDRPLNESELSFFREGTFGGMLHSFIVNISEFQIAQFPLLPYSPNSTHKDLKPSPNSKGTDYQSPRLGNKHLLE